MKILAFTLAGLLGLSILTIMVSGRAEFVAGGALVNLGFRLQDHLDAYDPAGDLKASPQQIFDRLLTQNAYAAKVHDYFARATRHPLVAMVVCMDARIDTSELVGDTRKYYYVLRTAGSVLSPQEEDMLELAVENGVKVILLTTHTNCAAERAARDPALRARYPDLVKAVDERPMRNRELLARPAIKRRIERAELVVRHVHIDTNTAHMELDED